MSCKRRPILAGFEAFFPDRPQRPRGIRARGARGLGANKQTVASSRSWPITAGAPKLSATRSGSPRRPPDDRMIRKPADGCSRWRLVAATQALRYQCGSDAASLATAHDRGRTSDAQQTAAADGPVRALSIPKYSAAMNAFARIHVVVPESFRNAQRIARRWPAARWASPNQQGTDATYSGYEDRCDHRGRNRIAELRAPVREGEVVDPVTEARHEDRGRRVYAISAASPLRDDLCRSHPCLFGRLDQRVSDRHA